MWIKGINTHFFLDLALRSQARRMILSRFSLLMLGYTTQGVVFLKRDATLISPLRGAPVGNTGGSNIKSAGF